MDKEFYMCNQICPFFFYIILY